MDRMSGGMRGGMGGRARGASLAVPGLATFGGPVLSRRGLLRLTAASLGTLALGGLSACGGGDAGKNGEVNIFMFAEYIPDSVVSDFEKESGIKVNLSTYATNEEMLAKVQSVDAGTYDIVNPTGYMVKRMSEQGMLEKIDKGKLDNLKNIGSQYLGKDYDPDNSYCIPYLSSVTSLAANTKKVGDGAITKWTDIFDSKYANSLSVLDSYIEVIGATELALGLKTISESDASKFPEIEKKVLSLKPNIKVFEVTPQNSLISGDADVALLYSAMTALAQQDNPDIEPIFPEEGSLLAIDHWALPKGAKNVNNALAFIDYMLKPETAQKVSEEFPYVQPNVAAVELLGDDFKGNKAKNVPEEVFQTGYFAEPLSTETSAAYNDIWTELKK